MTNEENYIDERKLIAVDFDGTLTHGGRFWKDGEEILPNEEIIKWVNKQFRLRNVIIIHTARPPETYRETEAWLIAHGVKFHGLRFGKLTADLYIDDKNAGGLKW